MSLTFAAGNLLTVRLGYDNNDAAGVAFNVLHYQIGSMVGPPPAMGAGLAAIGQAMYIKFAALWSPAAGDDTKMEAVAVTNVFPLPRSVTTTYQPTVATTGASPTDSLPLQDAPTLLKTTEVGQRWGLGRLFYVGLAEEFNDSGHVTAGALTALGNFAAALKDSVSVTLGGWSVVLNPVLVRGPEDNPVSLTAITGGRLATASSRARSVVGREKESEDSGTGDMDQPSDLAGRRDQRDPCPYPLRASTRDKSRE